MTSPLAVAELTRKEETSKIEPLICTPLVGKNDTELLNEVTNIRYKKPDVIEWRADFYEDLIDSNKVFNILTKIRSEIPNTPILFTIRSVKEGGQPISLTERGKVGLLASLCARGLVEMVDYELNNDQDNIDYVRHFSLKHNVKMIISYHNFEQTPNCSELVELCKKANGLDADIVKIAVMPHNMADVLELLRATDEVQQTIDAELITISMGKFGTISRLFGWAFGSSMTFGVGEQSSAPGQVPIEDLRKVIEITQKLV